jgi:cation diffusion facilitator family transporter
MNGETRALKLSAIMSLLMAGLGIAFAFLAGSNAILLDGFFSLIGFVGGLITIRVARLVQQPPDEHFHFGYAQFEPFLNLGKGLLTLGVAAFALVAATVTIVEGGRDLEPGIAVIYAVIAVVGGLIVAWVQHRAASRTNSPLLEVDAKNWIIDSVLSAVVALTFLAAVFLERGSLAWVVPYIDSVLVIVLVLAILRIPIRVAKTSLGELLSLAPEAETQDDIRRRFDSAVQGLPLAGSYVRMVRVGRFFYVLNQLVLKPEYRLTRVGELDEIRGRIARAMEGAHPGFIMDTVFTEDEKWVK